MIICGKCGHQNDSSNYFCEKCGNDLLGDTGGGIDFIEEFEDDFEEKGYEDDAFFDDF